MSISTSLVVDGRSPGMIEGKDASSKCVIAVSRSYPPVRPRSNREEHPAVSGSLTPDHDLRIIAERAGFVYPRGCIDLAPTTPILISRMPISHSPGTHYPASASNRPRPKRITSNVCSVVWKGRRPETKSLSASRTWPSFRFPMLFSLRVSHNHSLFLQI